jgi:hypothetical protein
LRSLDSEPAATQANPVTESATGTKGERLWQSCVPLLLAAPAALALRFLVLPLVGLRSSQGFRYRGLLRRPGIITAAGVAGRQEAHRARDI